MLFLVKLTTSGGQEEKGCYRIVSLGHQNFDCRSYCGLSRRMQGNTYILLTKREGRTGRISARGLDSTGRAQRGPYEKDRGPIFSQDGPEQAWLIRDLLHD